jgi:hypothetical protein
MIVAWLPRHEANQDQGDATMNNTKPNETQRAMASTAAVRGPAATQAFATVRTSVAAPVTGTTYGHRAIAPIEHPRDGHWAFYACVAVFCLAVTFVILSFAARGFWD